MTVSCFKYEQILTSLSLVLKHKPKSSLTPATPNNKLIYGDALTTDKAGGLSARRSEVGSTTSSQNIFARRFSKSPLSRKDSIFTHASCDVSSPNFRIQNNFSFSLDQCIMRSNYRQEPSEPIHPSEDNRERQLC